MDRGIKEYSKQILKMLAPYFAVGIFWCIFSNAWLSILMYHVQILFWSRKSFQRIHRPALKHIMFFALPAALTGPLVYFLMPYITHTDLVGWLENHHLTRLSLMAMIPYFGLLHPFLEQLHWGPLRKNIPPAHFMFAGYHMIVLYSLLTMPWLVLCFIVLTSASFIWKNMETRPGGLSMPLASHVLADLGIIIAAWLRT